MQPHDIKPFLKPALFDVPHTSLKMKLVTSAYEGMTVSYLRYLVFVIEQQIDVALEFDGSDAYAVSFIMFDGTNPIGTIRYYKDEQGFYHIGRVAILASYRSKGYGKAMMVWMHQYLKLLFQNVHIVIHAQAYLVDWYAKLGYQAEGPLFTEAGIVHQMMKLTL
jgi:predicted GNAT family N-acyltransferase